MKMFPSAGMPFVCFLSMIRPPGITFESGYLQILPVNKGACPMVRSHSDVGFQLYTRHNPVVYEELFIGDDKRLAASHLDFKDRTIIYFHAFLESSDASSALLMREAYILRGDTNVIMIDAQRLEAGPWYITAAENTWYIGQFAAQFIDYLVSKGLDLSKTHLIGHSLGAQSAGVAGSALRSGRVARITGLDPAMPLFEKLPLSQKLDSGDADFVDVIHTDAGIFGVSHPIGHADFYPNGGISPQPGCELEALWPNQLIIEKCKTHSTQKPLKGMFFFALEPNRDTHKQALKHEHKTQKHFGYTKKERNEKRTPKNDKKFSVATVIDQVTGDNENVGHTKKDLSAATATQRNDDLEASYQNQNPVYTTKHRAKRFISFFKRQPDDEHDNFLFKMVEFLVKNRKAVIPVVSVMREINTLVKSSNGELNHSTKEKNNYIGATPVLSQLPTINLELGKDPPGKALMKRLLGLGSQSDRLVVSGASGGLFGK